MLFSTTPAQPLVEVPKPREMPLMNLATKKNFNTSGIHILKWSMIPISFVINV